MSTTNKKVINVMFKNDKRISKSFIGFDGETRQDLLQNIEDPSQFIDFYMEWLSKKKHFSEGEIVDDIGGIEYTTDKYLQSREEKFKEYLKKASDKELNELYSKYNANHPIVNFMLDFLPLIRGLAISSDNLHDFSVIIEDCSKRDLKEGKSSEDSSVFSFIQKEIVKCYAKDGNPCFLKKLAVQDFKQVIPVVRDLLSEGKYNNLFLHLLESNYEETMKLIEGFDENYLFSSVNKSKFIDASDEKAVTKILAEHKFSDVLPYQLQMQHVPFSFVEALYIDQPRKIIRKLHSLRNCDMDKFIQVHEDELPVNTLPIKYFLNRINDTYKRDLALSVMNDNYSKELENKLLKEMGSRNNSVEEEIVQIYKNNPQAHRNDLTPLELMAFNLYIKKKAHEAGKDIKTNIFDFGCAGNARCSYDDLSINVLPVNLPLTSMLHCVNHEINHLKQSIQLENIDFTNPDIDVMAKDFFLREVSIRVENDAKLDFNYYKANYFNESAEYDADFRAYMETVEMLGIKDDCYEHYCKELYKLENIAQDVNPKVERIYYHNNTRKVDDHGKVIEGHIDDIIEYVLENSAHFPYFDKRPGNKYYKLLDYEYDLTKTTSPRKRSVVELAKLLNSAQTDKEKNIYINLLANRVNPAKEKPENIKGNIEDVKKVLDSGLLKPTIQEMIERIPLDRESTVKKTTTSR